MMRNYSNLHDAEIIGIKLNDGNLSLSIKTSSAALHDVIFVKAIAWVLSPFYTQNVIMNLHEYSKEMLNDSIIEYFSIEEKYSRLVFSHDFTAYCITSSVGLDGFIIAKDILINKVLV